MLVVTIVIMCFSETNFSQSFALIYRRYGTMITRIAAAFIVSGDRLISRIGQYRTLASNNCISNVDHVTVRHRSSEIRDTQHAS